MVSTYTHTVILSLRYYYGTTEGGRRFLDDSRTFHILDLSLNSIHQSHRYRIRLLSHNFGGGKLEIVKINLCNYWSICEYVIKMFYCPVVTHSLESGRRQRCMLWRKYCRDSRFSFSKIGLNIREILLLLERPPAGAFSSCYVKLLVLSTPHLFWHRTHILCQLRSTLSVWHFFVDSPFVLYNYGQTFYLRHQRALPLC